MKEEKIHDALNFLDNDMIEQVDKLRNIGTERKSYWTKGLAMAACICLIFGGIFAYGIHKDKGKPNGDGGTVASGEKTDSQFSGAQGDFGNSTNEQISSMDKNQVDVATLTGNGSEQEVKFPRVLVEILEWEEGQLLGKILDKKDADMFEIGSDISVYWEDYIVLVAYTEGYGKYLYRNYGAPTQEQFPVGSSIMVDVDSYEVKAEDVRYEIYTECIGYVKE